MYAPIRPPDRALMPSSCCQRQSLLDRRDERRDSSRHRNTRIIYIKVYCKYYSCGHAVRPCLLHMFSSFVLPVRPIQKALCLFLFISTPNRTRLSYSSAPLHLGMRKKSKCSGPDWIGIRLSHPAPRSRLCINPDPVGCDKNCD